ncbi:hypothetical protein E0V98_24395 [Salmonella enterica subsp. enterica serovar Poona]|nr:hypothetical protein [Salmonella enterica subsp. enterica serovar Poona]EDP9162384.1 hypothetical protein [Salmonella enterica subsp. enterica serovar Poona]EED7686523.1 hypothetical protein [Salmonella enterica subsp. enterica serovar Poona]
MSNNISKGFHRIGIILAAIVLVLGVILTVPHHSNSVSTSVSSVAGISLSQILGMISSFACAAIMYSIVRLVGWLVNGFSGNDSVVSESNTPVLSTDITPALSASTQYQGDRQVSRLLWVGIILLPIIFVWFLFRKGYPISTRVCSIVYVLLSLWFGYHILSKPEPRGALIYPRTSSSYTPTQNNTNVGVELNTDDSGRQSTELAKQRVKALLEDPSSAQFGLVKFYPTSHPSSEDGVVGAVCGGVNSKNTSGKYIGYRRFIMGVISVNDHIYYSKIQMEDGTPAMSDVFDSIGKRICR